MHCLLLQALFDEERNSSHSVTRPLTSLLSSCHALSRPAARPDQSCRVCILLFMFVSARPPDATAQPSTDSQVNSLFTAVARRCWKPLHQDWPFVVQLYMRFSCVLSALARHCVAVAQQWLLFALFSMHAGFNVSMCLERASLNCNNILFDDEDQLQLELQSRPSVPNISA